MKNTAWIIVSGLLILTASCRDANFIGEELLPEQDFLNSERIDSFKIISYTERDDSVVTSVNPFYALGSLNSDTYGKSTGTIYTQVLLPTNNLFFGDAPAVDSIVLTLDYAGYYGDSAISHNISVHRMIDRLDAGRLYYSDQKFQIIPIPIGQKSNFKPNLTDSVILGNGSAFEPHLRIPLFQSFGQNLIALDSNVLENDTTFLNFLSGICIRPDTLTGFSNGIMYFDMLSSISGVRIYYHNAEADSLEITFPFTGAKVNSFTHEYPITTPVYTALTSPDTVDGDAFTYVQGFAGLKTVLKIPTITDLEDVSINNAELIVKATSNDGRYFAPPPRLQLVQLDSLGRNFYYFIRYSLESYGSITDDNLGFTDIGGTITKSIDESGRVIYIYKYIITRHIQEMLQGSVNNHGFALVCRPGNRIPNAVTLGGADVERFSFKPYLTVTYTTINK